MYKIEKEIPIPAKCKYPFAYMEVGDSFFIPSEEGDKRCSIRSMATQKGLKVRTVKESSGIRVWRVK